MRSPWPVARIARQIQEQNLHRCRCLHRIGICPCCEFERSPQLGSFLVTGELSACNRIRDVSTNAPLPRHPKYFTKARDGGRPSGDTFWNAIRDSRSLVSRDRFPGNRRLVACGGDSGFCGLGDAFGVRSGQAARSRPTSDGSKHRQSCLCNSVCVRSEARSVRTGPAPGFPLPRTTLASAAVQSVRS